MSTRQFNARGSTCLPSVFGAILLLGLLGLFSIAAAAATTESLIQRLGDLDPLLREQAENELKQLGVSARPALVRASRGDDPAVAAAAARVLLALPWEQPQDPPAVRTVLARYGQTHEAIRIKFASELAELPDQAGVPALLRLLLEDPSEDVCWKIVSMLAPRRDAHTQAAIRSLQPPDTRPAALTLAARAWFNRDRNRAIDMLRRAVQAEARQPSIDDGELDWAFDRLADEAVARRQYHQAANLRRQQAARIGTSRDAYPLPVYHLFALHADFGPLDGFEQDVLNYLRSYGANPPMLYALSRILSRQARSIEAAALEQTALAASLTPRSRWQTGEFLASSGWDHLARREWQTLLAWGEQPELQPYLLSVRVRLADLAARQDCPAAAIEHLKAALALVNAAGGQISATTAEGRVVHLQARHFAAQIAWRSAELARRGGDADAANRHLDELLQLQPLDSGVLLDAYPLLVDAGRRDDALKAFQSTCAQQRAELEHNPDDASLLNELAWLCARCDQNLPEALELAQRAVMMEPDNPAYLDTLAEVHFRMGNAAEAVRLETRALELDPGDEFMLEQLQRFGRK
ncbi:BTAD domain-containing putative transcriptional regulator [Fontivita pretiosa]|uniref:BTAD domain-containing putative transcriptional regulator n=1 Tax=Fontivita pretiosa TaxID=2989684 RepID=UPI003D17BFC0